MRCRTCIAERFACGDDAPDASLLALDGTTRFHIRERTGARPLVIVFGSYT